MKNLKGLGLSKYCITKSGEVYSLRSERFLKLQNKGYLMISLKDDNGQTKNLYVHRLVAMAYVDGYSEELHVNHIDGDKSNNHYTNLEWVTRSQNMIHAYRTGLLNGTGKGALDEETVHRICRYLEQGSRPSDVARMVGVTPFNVQDILEGESFTYVSSEYNFSKVKRKFRLSEDKVLKICKLLAQNYSVNKVAEVTDTKLVNVRRIFRRETFTHLSSQFSW